MNSFNKFFGAIFTTAMFASLAACDSMFHDELADCPQGVYVNFRTKTACDEEGREVGKVERLHVFAFDSKGKLAAVKDTSNVNVTKDFSVLMPVSNGTYSFLAWTGVTDANFEAADLQIGKTTPKDLMLRLRQRGETYNNLSGKTVFQGEADSLTTLEAPELVGTIYKNNTVNLQEKTTRIKVKVKLDESLKGRENVDINNFKLSLSSNNGRMLINGTTPKNYPSAFYPQNVKETIVGDSILLAEYTILDLIPQSTEINLVDTKATDPNDRVLWSKDLYGTALLNDIGMRNPKFNLDCDRDVEVVFVIADKCKDCGTYMCVQITVNAWEVHSYSVHLGEDL